MPQALRTDPANRHRPPVPGGDADDALLLGMAKRDRQAFASLYRRYVDPVYRYCDRCLGNRELAEDATSLIFTKALAALDRCHDDAFRSWLFTIAHNVILDMRRQQRNVGSLDEAAEVADRGQEHSPEAQALASDDARTIRALLVQLPDEQRHLLELRLAGLTDAEIARVLGRSHGAVRMSQYRAIARLRALIGVLETPKEGPHGSK